MPLYEYECQSCSHRFEELVRSSEDAPPCPACQSHAISKLLSAFSVASGAVSQPAAGACGRCGDPRGPGACGRN